VILVAAALLASAALADGRRGVLRYLWMIDLAGAAAAIAWDVAAGRTGAAMPLNRVLVVGNIAAAVVSVALDTRRHTWTRDGWIVLSGAAVFAASRGRAERPPRPARSRRHRAARHAAADGMRRLRGREPRRCRPSGRVAAVGRELETGAADPAVDPAEASPGRPRAVDCDALRLDGRGRR
jgi:hypothetical protein